MGLLGEIPTRCEEIVHDWSVDRLLSDLDEFSAMGGGAVDPSRRLGRTATGAEGGV
jgi:hypothetical protein